MTRRALEETSIARNGGRISARASLMVGVLSESFRDACREIWIQWIGDNFPIGGNDHQIHIFHWDGTEEDFVTEDYRPYVAFPIRECYVNRTDIRA